MPRTTYRHQIGDINRWRTGPWGLRRVTRGPLRDDHQQQVNRELARIEDCPPSSRELGGLSTRDLTNGHHQRH
jgi:hypothetical protein